MPSRRRAKTSGPGGGSPSTGRSWRSWQVATTSSSSSSCTAHADLRLGDLISVSVMKTADRQESDRRWAEWKGRGADTDHLPETLPMRITRFLRVSPAEVIEIPPDHPGTQRLVSYLIGSAS